MATHPYSYVVASSLKVTFKCDECDTINTISGIVEPGSKAETPSTCCKCKGCGKGYRIASTDNGIDGFVEIENLKEGNIISVKQVHWESKESIFHLIDGTTDIENAIKAIDNIDDKVQQYLYRLILANEFSLLEESIKLEIMKIEPEKISSIRKYQNIEILRDQLKRNFGIIIDSDKIVEHAYTLRNTIIHENAVLHDGDTIEITSKELIEYLGHIHNFAINVLQKLKVYGVEKLFKN